MSVAMALYEKSPGPLRTVAATLRGLYLRAQQTTAEGERLVAAARERERWSAQQWQQWQGERLAFVLEHAAVHVPFYRDQWAVRRRRGDRASWTYLENWPILERETLLAHPHAFIADDCHVGRLNPVHTRGTTGTPLRLWRSPDTARTLRALLMVRTQEWNGLGNGDASAHLSPEAVVPRAQRRPPFWVWDAARRRLLLSARHFGRETAAAYLDALVRHRTVHLHGPASLLHELAVHAIESGRADLPVRVVTTDAEPLVAEYRCTIGEAFRSPVRETYSVVEAVAAASECAHGRLHAWPEIGIVEVLEGDRPVEPEVLGDLVCTGLLNTDMPLVRYRVGDCGRRQEVMRPCACGRMMPPFVRIEGRDGNVLLTQDGRRVAWLAPTFHGLAVRESQIVQEAVGRVRVRFVPAPGYEPAMGHTIRARLQARLGGDLQVVLECVDALPRNGHGSHRSVTVVCDVRLVS